MFRKCGEISFGMYCAEYLDIFIQMGHGFRTLICCRLLALRNTLFVRHMARKASFMIIGRELDEAGDCEILRRSNYDPMSK